MNGNDIVDNKNDIKVFGTVDPLTSSLNLQTRKNFSREQEDESSSGSSPSTLKKRLQELPSTARSLDRTSLGHRIYNREEICHRSESARNYVELKENKEEKNKIIPDSDEVSSISSSHRSQGARARRRAKIRSEILEEIDKSLAATRSSLNDFLNFIDKSDEERKSTGRSVTDSIESLESNKIDDQNKDLSMVHRRNTLIVEPMTSRSYYRDEEDGERDLVTRQSKSAKEDRNSYDCKDNVKGSNRLFKNRIELRPLKYGGYRPHTGIIVNNPSSDSEMDGPQEHANNFVTRKKICSPVSVNTELSTPVSNVHKLQEEGIKTVPVLSARNDDNNAISSFRSLEETPTNRISIRCNTINDNVNTFVRNTTPYLEENLNHGNNVRINNINSLPLTSDVETMINEKMENHESFEIHLENETRENSYKIPDEIVRRKVNSKSVEDLITFPKHQKEQHSRLHSAKYYSHREDSVSISGTDGRSPSRISNDYQREKTPSFLNVKLIEDLEALDASDDDKESNVAKVPVLPLHSEDVSRSTSAGSKIYTQNRSLDRNLVDSREKETSSMRFRHGSSHDNDKIETFESESSIDKISMLNRTWQEPISIESMNLRENYDELDIMRQSRRAYSAPCQKLSNETMQMDSRMNDSNIVPSNLREYTQEEIIRCKSADISRQDVSNKQNFTQLSDSPYSSHFARSMDSVSVAEDYQTLSDPLEMSYSRDEEFNTNIFDYGIACMYPRQSHLSVLQEESETRLEESGRSETTVAGKKDSNNESVNKINENNKVSTISFEDHHSIESKIEEKRTSQSIETKEQIVEGDNLYENNENSDNSTKNDSLSNTRESSANSTVSNSQSENSESNNEDDKIENIHEEGDNEFQSDKKSYDETIDTTEDRSKKIYDKSNGPENMILENNWLINDENTKMQYITYVQAETTMFMAQRAHNNCPVPKNSCSTSRLHCTSEGTKNSPRFRNKNCQDRFPFTISETRSMISTSNKKQGHCEIVNNKTRSLETFRSLTDPIFKDYLKAPVEKVDCFNYDERQEQRNLVPRMKGLVRRFSRKFKISKKRIELDMDDPSTKVIYQNQECQVDSMPESCSDDSSIKESSWVGSRSAKARSSIISSGRSLKKANSLENLTGCSDYPRRRFDRDDLWVKELQKCLPTSDTAKTSSKERFSLFVSRNSGSSLSEKAIGTPEKNERTSCKKEDQIKILKSYSSLVSNVIESNAELKKERKPTKIEESNDEARSGCVCLKIFKMMTCPLFVRSHGDSLIESKQRSKKR